MEIKTKKTRRDGKLESYKIEALNRAGMTWNPTTDEWEHYYEMYKFRGLCLLNEDWVKEQRALYEKNELSNENLIRLEAVDFPFIADKNENFRLSSNHAYYMIKAMDDGNRTYEYQAIKPKKVASKKVTTKKESQLSERQIRNLKSEIDFLFSRKKSPKEYGTQRNVAEDIYFDAFKYLRGSYSDRNGK